MENIAKDTTESVAALPSTVDFIGHHAGLHPDDVALCLNGRDISYNTLYQDIGRMVVAFRGFGLHNGDIVGIDHPNLYLHWLAILSLEALGVVTFSSERTRTPDMNAAFSTADLVICAPDNTPPEARRIHVMDEKWVDSVRQLTPEPPVAIAPAVAETPMRIVRSSGTTGTLKRMIRSARAREFWIRQYRFRSGFNRRSRYLISMGFHIEVFVDYVAACIRMGGTCVYDTRDSISAVLASQAITHITLPPFVLIQVLDSLPSGYQKLPDLTVFTIGAALPKSVRQRVLESLAGEIVESYGTQEIAPVCTIGADGIGRILPGVQVEVVDDNEQPVQGTPGRVRIRSDGSVGRYIDDPATTARMFRDGWFYPGDIAVLQDRLTLRLVGREDDMLNVQGIKFIPGPLEEQLRPALPVTDLCVTSIADENGASRLWVVVVPENADAMAVIRDRLPALLPTEMENVRLAKLDAIPRTATGKILRSDVNTALAQAEQNR